MSSNPNRPTLKRVRLVTVDCDDTLDGAVVINGPADVATVARAILPTDREGMVVIHLDARHRVRSADLASVGTLTMSFGHPREIFKAAILANACAIILAHNHPSGDPTPSEEDVTLTRRMEQAGDLIGIRVLDHVIVTRRRFHSMLGEEGR